MKSSLREVVPIDFIAPTVITYGSFAGARIVPYPRLPPLLLRPSLPAATTTTIPAFQAASTAWHSGSLR